MLKIFLDSIFMHEQLLLAKKREHLLAEIKTLTSEQLVAHPDWSFIAHDPYLSYELLKSGSFIYPEKIAVEIDFMLSLFLAQSNPPRMDLIKPEFLHNQSFLLQLLENNAPIMRFIPAQYINESLLYWYIDIFSAKPVANYIPKELITHEIAEILVKKHAMNFIYLPDEFKNNEIIYAQASQHLLNRAEIFKHSGLIIRNNENFVMQALEADSSLFHILPEKFHDPEFFLRFLAKIQQLDFTHFSQLPLTDYDEKIWHSITSLMACAPPAIQDNEHCAWQTILLYPPSLSHISERLKNNSSFALQVASDLADSDFEKTFGLWHEHVRENREVISELLPIIIRTNTISLISEKLLADFSFMTLLASYDPASAIIHASGELAVDPEFFISIYERIEQREGTTGHSNAQSPQNKLFKLIHTDAANDIDYILGLYEHFKSIFEQIIFPCLIGFSGELIEQLKEAHEVSHGLIRYMDKAVLKKSLENKLEVHEKSSQIKKI